jgi:hypothetical protein
MREAKLQKPCPACKTDLAEFLKSAPVNTDMAAIISSLMRAAKQEVEQGEGEEEEEDDAVPAAAAAAAPAAQPGAAFIAERVKAAAALERCEPSHLVYCRAAQTFLKLLPRFRKPRPPAAGAMPRPGCLPARLTLQCAG